MKERWESLQQNEDFAPYIPYGMGAGIALIFAIFTALLRNTWSLEVSLTTYGVMVATVMATIYLSRDRNLVWQQAAAFLSALIIYLMREATFGEQVPVIAVMLASLHYTREQIPPLQLLSVAINTAFIYLTRSQLEKSALTLSIDNGDLPIRFSTHYVVMAVMMLTLHFTRPQAIMIKESSTLSSGFLTWFSLKEFDGFLVLGNLLVNAVKSIDVFIENIYNYFEAVAPSNTFNHIIDAFDPVTDIRFVASLLAAGACLVLIWVCDRFKLHRLFRYLSSIEFFAAIGVSTYLLFRIELDDPLVKSLVIGGAFGAFLTILVWLSAAKRLRLPKISDRIFMVGIIAALLIERFSDDVVSFVAIGIGVALTVGFILEDQFERIVIQDPQIRIVKLIQLGVIGIVGAVLAAFLNNNFWEALAAGGIVTLLVSAIYEDELKRFFSPNNLQNLVHQRSIAPIGLGLLIGGIVGAISSQILIYPTQHCTFGAPMQSNIEVSQLQYRLGVLMTLVSSVILLLPVWTVIRRGRLSADTEAVSGYFKSKLLPLAFLAPTLLILGVFLYYPGTQVITLSLKLARLGGPREIPYCLTNYEKLATSGTYQGSFMTSLSLTVGIVFFSMAVSLSIAVLASQKIRGVNIYRTFLIWPYAISPVVAGVIFLVMFNPVVGIVNWMLREAIGTEVFSWILAIVIAIIVSLQLGAMLRSFISDGGGYDEDEDQINIERAVTVFIGLAAVVVFMVIFNVISTDFVMDMANTVLEIFDTNVLILISVLIIAIIASLQVSESLRSIFSDIGLEVFAYLAYVGSIVAMFGILASGVFNIIFNVVEISFITDLMDSVLGESIGLVIVSMAVSFALAFGFYQFVRQQITIKEAAIAPDALAMLLSAGIFIVALFPVVWLVGIGMEETIGRQPLWFQEPSLTPWVIVAAAVWNSLGFNILFYMAGLQSIPTDLLEAASIDGANRFQRFFRITFPLLSPYSFFLLITNVTYSFFGVFGAVDVLTQGGPWRQAAGGESTGATNVLIYNVYRDAFEFRRLSDAAAQSLVLFILVAGITILQFRYIESRVTYGGEG